MIGRGSVANDGIVSPMVPPSAGLCGALVGRSRRLFRPLHRDVRRGIPRVVDTDEQEEQGNRGNHEQTVREIALEHERCDQ